MLRPTLRLMSVLGLLTGVSHAQEANAPEPSSMSSTLNHEQRHEVAAVWDKLEAALDEVRSGVVRVREVHTRGETEQEIDYFIAFDHRRDWLRFDYRSGTRRTLYARNDKESLLCIPAPNGFPISISRRGRDDPVDVFDARPFDLRLVGLTWYPMHVGKWELKKVLEFSDKHFWKGDPTTFEVDGDRIRLVWEKTSERAGSMGRCELVLDRSQGMRPVRCTAAVRHREGDEWEVNQSSTATWTKQSGSWVPKTWVLESRSTSSRATLRFDWESVNEHVAPRLFQVEGFDAPKGTLVRDKTPDAGSPD